MPVPILWIWSTTHVILTIYLGVVCNHPVVHTKSTCPSGQETFLKTLVRTLEFYLGFF